jgi:hypothetical protein
MLWINPYPWPQQVVMDCGRKFMGSSNCYDWTGTPNHPQHDPVQANQKRGRPPQRELGWHPFSSGVFHAIHSPYNHTGHICPTSVQSRCNAQRAIWSRLAIHQRTQTTHKNTKQAEHTYKVRDKVVIEQDPNTENLIRLPMSMTMVWSGSNKEPNRVELSFRHEISGKFSFTRPDHPCQWMKAVASCISTIICKAPHFKTPFQSLSKTHLTCLQTKHCQGANAIHRARLHFTTHLIQDSMKPI